MHTTSYVAPCTASTVRQTPLCARLWSTFNSPAKEHSISRRRLPPSRVTLRTVPISSTIPVNTTGIVFGIFFCLCFCRPLYSPDQVHESGKHPCFCSFQCIEMHLADIVVN